MITIQDGDMELLRQIKELDDTLAEIPDFNVKFLSEIEDYNKDIKSINDSIQKLQDQIAEVTSEIQKEEQNIGTYKKEISFLQNELKSKENVNNIEAISENITLKNYRVILAEKKLAQKNAIIKKKNTEIEDLNSQKKNIEQVFEQIKSIIENNNTHAKNDLDTLKQKKMELVNKLSNDVKYVYNNKLNSKTQVKPLAILINGICSNCNLLNITKQQLDILLQKHLVTCEYCSSILVGVVNNDKMSRENRKNHEQKDDNYNDEDYGIGSLYQE